MVPNAPQFAAKAKHVIHIFANGGPSHVDTFDPKPSLAKYAGQMLPNENLRTERKTGAAFPSPFKFQKYGQSGTEVSELFANTAQFVDDMAIIRSMHADVPNHEPSLMLMNCGESRLPRPSFGSWITYGLGTENQNLPGFIAMCPGGYPIKDAENWQSAFLPGAYQGTYINTQHTELEKLVENVRNAADQSRRSAPAARPGAGTESPPPGAGIGRCLARMRGFTRSSWLTACKWRPATPSTCRASRSTCLDAYGEGVQARQLLIARRLIERGVRFVQVWHGAGQPWDNHDDIEVNHRKLAGQCDRGIAALLRDLKERGLLDETLVMWGGEFGRTPTVELPQAGANAGKVNGRDHNHYGFSMWLAGGGVKGGTGLRRHRRIRLSGRREQGSRPRPARHALASAGLRPQTAHLSLRRPRLPSDGCTRRCGKITDRVTCRMFR